jgi:hypothetical protein
MVCLEMDLDLDLDLGRTPSSTAHTTLDSHTNLVICIIVFRETPSGLQIWFYQQGLAWTGGPQNARNYRVVVANSTVSGSSVLCHPSPAICSARFPSSIYAH